MIGILQKLDFNVLLIYAIKGAIIIGSGFIIFEVVKSTFVFFQDKKLRKKMVVLKILPKSDIEMKEIEKLIKNVHSMLLNTKLRKYIYGRQYMSYEIGAKQGSINFYISVPQDLRERITDRIYASYSEIAIEVVKDYIPNEMDANEMDANEKKVEVYTSELALGFHHTLKVKTADIVGSILAAMKDLDEKDFVGVQILLRPLDNAWHIKGRKELEQFERKGIRPGEKSQGKGHKIVEKVDNIIIQITDEFTGGRASKTLVTGIPSRGGGKTKLERKEIVVAAEKVNDVGFDVVIRLVAAGKYKKGNTARITALVAAFTEINAENKFKRERIMNHNYIYNRFKDRKMALQDKENIFTPSELSGFVFRLPGSDLTEKYEEMERLMLKEFKAPSEAIATGKGIVIGSNKYRAHENLIEIKLKDLARHLVIQGKTGTGKSEWMKTMFLEQISNKYDENGKLINKGRGAMVLEPHGKLANELLRIIPKDRRKDVIEFDFFSDHPWAFNFCKVPKRDGGDLNPEQLAQKTLEEALEIFKRSFPDVWSSKNEYYIENAIRAIMDAELTMLELPRMFNDDKFRESVIPKIKDAKVKKFWQDKFKRNKQGKLDASVESTAQSVEYKLEKFLRSKELQRSLGQNDCIDFKEILDNNKIIIFKFGKRKMTKDAISFIGGIAIKLMIVAAFARDREMWEDTFTVFIDEAQNFVNESIKDVLYELRKYGIALILMHQELDQMNKVPGLLDAIYNNVGSQITFATGQKDALYFEKIYAPKIDSNDLLDLPERNGYCRLLVNGSTSDVFNLYSIDSPQVTEEVAEQSLKEIKAYNDEGKLSVDELDKMIAERYEAEEEEIYDLSEKSFGMRIEKEEEELNSTINLKKEIIAEVQEEVVEEVPEEVVEEEPEEVSEDTSQEKIEIEDAPEEIQQENRRTDDPVKEEEEEFFW